MKIKRVEICGFKSFVDKTVLKFDGRITGILGPNGCGKSNVVDAIQWASGEQRPKALRGKEMQDVIFAGSETRQPTSMAEVTITFDNVTGPTSDDVGANDVTGPTSDDVGANDVTGPTSADVGANDVTGPTSVAGPTSDDVGANDGSIRDQYAAYSEIQVTRRLYRSGESEYLLNKTPCRLRDIQELLMDAGVGRGSVSVIQQGKVGLIVSSAPGERRSIIEEAAGISKFKAKKRQATLKMEATQQNLLRVQDVLSELERQIRYLDRQARKAERFRRLKDEMRDLELKLGAHEYVHLTGEIESARKAVTAKKQDEAGAAARVAAAEGEIEVDRLALEEEEKALLAEQERLAELNSTIAREEQQLTNDQSRASELAVRAQQAAEDAVAASEEARSLAEEIERISAELTESVGAVDELESSTVATGQALSEAKEAQEAAVARVEELKQLLVEANQRVANANHQMGALGRRRTELDERIERIRGERDEVQGQVRDLEGKSSRMSRTLGDLKQFKLGLEEQRASLEQVLTDLAAELEHAQSELRDLREELSQKRSKLETLQELQSKLEGYGEGVRAIMQGADASRRPSEAPRRENGVHPQAGVMGPAEVSSALPPELREDDTAPALPTGIRGLVADVLDVPAELESAVEVVLGPRLQTVLVDTHGDAQRAIEYLEGTGSGRGSFLPEQARPLASGRSLPTHSSSRGRLSDLVTVKNGPATLAEALLGDVIVVDTIDAALTLWESDNDGWTFVTPDGTTLDPSGLLRGGAVESGAGLLARRRHIEELSAQTSGLTQRVATTEQQVAALTDRIKKNRKTLDKLLKDAQDEELKIVAHERDLEAVGETLSARRDRLDVLSRDVLDLSESLDEIGGEQEEAERQKAEGERAAAELEGEIRAAHAVVAEKIAAVESALTELTRLKVELASRKERREALEGSLDRMIRTRDELTSRSEKLTQTDVESRTERERLLSDSTQRTTRLEELIGTANQLKDQLSQRRSQFEEKQRGVRAREAEVRSVRDQLDEVRRAVSELTVSERELSVRIEHLVDGIAERYDADLEEDAQQWLDPELDIEAASETLAGLKERVGKMGEVNTGAISEYEEVKERQQFLSQQKEDLEKSLHQLKDAIAKINKTTRQRFVATFEAVNERFQEVFPRMFRGGRAALILTDPTEPLETGIDIVVQPPGKKLQNINLLSGGEKALTAVSLIIGIFLVRPTPFCLLDEVDAPLDDANVGRFNELIVEMARTSQFIVITHNKGTMAIAENLYGVTMEEPGVSKVVNVKFDGAKIASGERAAS